jgi:hypothetical protein
MQLNYFLVSLLASLFILGKNVISNLDIFDIFLPFVSYKLDSEKKEDGN